MAETKIIWLLRKHMRRPLRRFLLLMVLTYRTISSSHLQFNEGAFVIFRNLGEETGNIGFTIIDFYSLGCRKITFPFVRNSIIIMKDKYHFSKIGQFWLDEDLLDQVAGSSCSIISSPSSSSSSVEPATSSQSSSSLLSSSPSPLPTSSVKARKK